MARYRKRCVEVEAVQWDGSIMAATPIITWVQAGGGTAHYRSTLNVIVIDTIEGPMTAGADWWIIRGVEGEFYPCKASVFEATYEEVIEGDDDS